MKDELQIYQEHIEGLKNIHISTSWYELQDAKFSELASEVVRIYDKMTARLLEIDVDDSDLKKKLFYEIEKLKYYFDNNQHLFYNLEPKNFTTCYTTAQCKTDLYDIEQAYNELNGIVQTAKSRGGAL